ncbi:hypothetical protein [Thiothrix winogradskyi]|uniref:STAS domain-containing protein n=1 Tax=Thiothrix winogradskyi TaxID=96472 RepID=A0ABY3T0I9_9GAMM|nr:hypothetical protein [Thiothrix winogradskyi]UJS25291.1 hypothetical protein L2Y54_04420 [Thiothrix winogradskyi]
MDFFKNEAETHLLQGLNIENRLDRVSLHGSLDLTHDAAGLALALKLKALLDGVVEVLSREQASGVLLEKISLQASDEVANPFA